jgi:cyanophycinase
MLLKTLLALTSASGKLFLAGGDAIPSEVVERFIDECGGPNALIVVMPLATKHPKRDQRTLELLRRHGARNLYVFAKAKPTPADLDELKAKLEVAKGVWMPGGSQSRILERLGKGWIEDTLRPLHGAGLNVFGTSAGAMVCSDVMIAGPGSDPDSCEIERGMGLTSWVVDTHFAERNREPRLRDALRSTGQERGVGINEREWIVIHEDQIIEIHGTPTIIDFRPTGLSGATNRLRVRSPILSA